MAGTLNDEFTDASTTMQGTLAGAKNIKYKAKFRHLHNSSLQSKKPTDDSKGTIEVDLKNLNKSSN